MFSEHYRGSQTEENIFLAFKEFPVKVLVGGGEEINTDRLWESLISTTTVEPHFIVKKLMPRKGIKLSSLK